jgi:hypothetical protein
MAEIPVEPLACHLRKTQKERKGRVLQVDDIDELLSRTPAVSLRALRVPSGGEQLGAESHMAKRLKHKRSWLDILRCPAWRVVKERGENDSSTLEDVDMPVYPIDLSKQLGTCWSRRSPGRGTLSGERNDLRSPFLNLA